MIQHVVSDLILEHVDFRDGMVHLELTFQSGSHVASCPHDT